MKPSISVNRTATISVKIATAHLTVVTKVIFTNLGSFLTDLICTVCPNVANDAAW